VIRLDRVVYAVGRFRLDVSLEIADGEYFVLMGPTGSGKTACIECVAGLRPLTSGRIEIGGRDVTGTAPRRRSVGYVPQDCALFAHRTVRGNIAFGPQARRLSRAAVAEAVHEAARLTGTDHLLDRRVQGLSGGERQRVALARSLALRPELLILDEPVSALDEPTRDQICAMLRRLQRLLGVPALHVCHNVEEAVGVADRAAVIRDGHVEQVGSMEELLRRPRTEFVARFMRCENILAGRAAGAGPGGTTIVRLDGFDLAAPGRLEGAVTLVIRPENVLVARAADPPDPLSAGTTTARLVRAVDRGAYVRLELEGARPLSAHVSLAAFRQLGAVPGSALRVSVRTDGIHALPVGADRGEETEDRTRETEDGETNR
jgi:ABC-type Fe3+/spermidine/putrescine transport system ATPase subunit